MSTKHALAKIKIRAEIGGTDFEVVGCHLDYALSSIPRCSLELAVGRNVRTNTPAKVHTSQDSLEHMKPMKVYADIEGKFSDSESWPGGEKLVFEGYLTGCGYQKQRGDAQFRVDGMGWLGDLDFSSVLTEMAHPSNPWATSTHSCRPDSGGGLNEQPTLTSTLCGADFFSYGNVTGDLWGSAIHPYLTKLAEVDLADIKYSGGGGDCSVAGGKGNRKAAEALKRMGPGGKYYKALTLKATGGDPELGEAVAGFLNDGIADTDYYGSFWGIIINRLAASFMFAVVPQAEKAIVVPFLPTMSKTYRREIYVEDQEMLSLNKSFARPLKGVLIYAGTSVRTGLADQAESDAPSGVLTGGCYAPGGPDDPGMILSQPAPQWLQDVIPLGLSDPQKTANQGRKSTTTPTGGGGAKTDKTPKEAAQEMGDLYNLLAKSVYGNEILRGRVGTVVGKLRFDIAPGSMVKIHGSSEKHTGGDQLGMNMVGAVTHVSCSMNAETMQASTGFQFMAIRTEHENEVEKLTQSEHPLFAQSFDGAPLVEGYAM